MSYDPPMPGFNVPDDFFEWSAAQQRAYRGQGARGGARRYVRRRAKPVTRSTRRRRAPARSTRTRSTRRTASRGRGGFPRRYQEEARYLTRRVNVGGYAGPFPWVTVNAVRCRLHLRAGEWVNHGDKVRIYISPKEVRDSAGRYLGRWS